MRSIFSELHQRFMATQAGDIQKGELVRCLYFTCVHPSARRQGVMNALWRHSIDVARENGYEAITAQASTEDTRRVLNDELGFTQVADVSYKDFVVPPADVVQGGYVGAVFAELCEKSPQQYGGGLSIHVRRIPSNLYV